MFDIDTATRSYLETQLWTGTVLADNENDDQYPIGEVWDYDDIPADYIAHVREDIAAFYESYTSLVDEYVSRMDFPYNGETMFGHDYYLTREHHAVGFWDRGLGEVGYKLTDAAHDVGEAAYAFISDDGSLAFDYSSHKRLKR